MLYCSNWGDIFCLFTLFVWFLREFFWINHGGNFILQTIFLKSFRRFLVVCIHMLYISNDWPHTCMTMLVKEILFEDIVILGVPFASLTVVLVFSLDFSCVVHIYHEPISFGMWNVRLHLIHKFECDVLHNAVSLHLKGLQSWLSEMLFCLWIV